MSLVKFGYTVDMVALANPLIPESFLVGYDLDGILKQKDYLGNVTAIGSVISGAQSNFFLSDTVLDSNGNKTASIYRSGNLRIGTTQSYTQMSGSTFSIYTNNGGTPSLYFSVDNNNLVINSSYNISGDKFYWNPSTGLQFNNNIDSFYSVFSSKGLSFSHIDSVIDITPGNVVISNLDYVLSLDINQGISYGSLTSSFIFATATGFIQTSNILTLLPTTLSTDRVQYYQDKSGTFSLVDDVINSSLFYLAGSTNSLIDSKTQSIYRDGNIGIGTSSPSTKLHIYATQSGAFRLQDGTQQDNYILKSDSNGVASWVSLATVGIIGASGSIPKFTGTSSLGNSRFFDDGITGSYGFGTSRVYFLSGNTWLTLNRSQAAMNFILGNPQSPLFQLGQIMSTNTIGLSIESAGYTTFKVGPSYSEAMRISSNGYVGIGMTATPSTKLHIYATQSGFGFRLQDGSEGNNYILTSNSIGMGSWTSSINVTGFRLQDGTQGSGYILTSDVNGVGTWTASTSSQTLAQTLTNGNLMGNIPIQIDNINRTYLKNSLGNDQLTNDVSNGLIARSSNGDISAKFNDRALYASTGFSSLDWENRKGYNAAGDITLDWSIAPYKVYTALLSQSGTASPTATVLKNTLGVSVSFTYFLAGNYYINAIGAFTGGKTYVDVGQSIYATSAYIVIPNLPNIDQVQIRVTKVTDNTSSDNKLTNFPIEIRVYN